MSLITGRFMRGGHRPEAIVLGSAFWYRSVFLFSYQWVSMRLDLESRQCRDAVRISRIS